MIALRLHDRHDLRLHEEPVPTPGEDEVLVRVTAVGLCGSDLHWFDEGRIGDVVLTQPLVLGHEFVGVIETGARSGERVALDPAIACGSCAPCHRRRREPLHRLPVCGQLDRRCPALAAGVAGTARLPPARLAP